MKPKFSLKRKECYFRGYILHDILVTLPAKSLVRFKCVCKDWFNMISDPDFEDLNFQHSMSKIMLLYQNHIEDVVCVDNSYESFKLDEKGCNPTKVSFFDLEPNNLKDCCNSLMLFEEVPVLPHFRKLYVYDAINKQKKKLPEIPGFWRCLLVSDASRKEYKAVAFNVEVCTEDMWIYSLNQQQEQQWIKYKLPYEQRLVNSCSSVAVNGVLYWIAKDYSPESAVYIQPMEISTEKLKRVLELPSGQRNYQLQLKEMKGSLCLLHRAYEYRLDIWILKDSVRNLWIKQHKIAPTDVLNFHFDSHPWLAVERCNGRTYILLTNEGDFGWFDMENQEVIKRITVESHSVLNSIRNPFAVLFIEP